jgi:hypothetical protein
MPSAALLEAVAVTAELCGRVFSEPAARVFVADLSGYPEESVMKALSRCRREVRGALTVADVVSRLDDGRPGPEEAWSMLPRTEAQTVVWTDEMRAAHVVALPLLNAGEQVPARMAFKEAYQRLVSEARDAGKPVNWSASLGHDKLGREAALLDAVRLGRLELERARDYAPSLPAPDKRVLQLLGRT